MALLPEILKNRLAQCLNSSITETELSEFVQLCRGIVQVHLQHIRPSLSRLCLNQGLTITDVAYDCIGDAFVRDDDNFFPKLQNFARSLHQPLEHTPEADVFLAFKTFLLHIAEAHLAHLYGQNDSAGSRIHRNLRDCIGSSRTLEIKKDFRGLVITPKDNDPCDNLPQFPSDELEREFAARANHQHTTPQLIRVLHDVLLDQSKYRRSIPLMDVVLLVKARYTSSFEPVEDEPPFSTDGLEEFEIEEIRWQVELVLKERILLTYLARGKLERREAEAVFNALRDIVEDWCHGERTQPSLLSYLKAYLPIDEAAYEETLRSKMEYLLKIARQEFAARLMKEL